MQTAHNILHDCTKFKPLCHIYEVDNHALLEYLAKSKLWPTCTPVYVYERRIRCKYLNVPNIPRNSLVQWRLVTMIRGGAATLPNKDFIRLKSSRFPRRRGLLRHMRFLFLWSNCETSLYCNVAVTCCGVNDWWGTGVFKVISTH